MKRKQIDRSVNLTMILASAVVLILALIIVPTRATAQASCATDTDTDGDGFTDAQECNGITLSQGNAFGGATFIPSCTTGVARSLCVDPNSRDVFVIVTRATPSLIPTVEPFKYIAAATSAGGLGITVHEITTTRTDRKVSDASPQLAARLRESLDTTDVILGSANQGIALDLATVFTQRIKNFVNSVCVVGTTCVDSAFAATINTPALVIDHYIRHTIAHELGGHVFTLAPVYNAKYGGNHYVAGSNVVMEQNVTYTKKGTPAKVTWYLSTAYTDPDRAGAKLQ